jgi:hypothetical protein
VRRCGRHRVPFRMFRQVGAATRRHILACFTTECSIPGTGMMVPGLMAQASISTGLTPRAMAQCSMRRRPGIVARASICNSGRFPHAPSQVLPNLRRSQRRRPNPPLRVPTAPRDGDSGIPGTVYAIALLSGTNNVYAANRHPPFPDRLLRAETSPSRCSRQPSGGWSMPLGGV